MVEIIEKKLKNDFLTSTEFKCKNCGSIEFEWKNNLKNIEFDSEFNSKSCKICNRFEEYYDPECDKICFMLKFPVGSLDYTNTKKDISNWIN